MQINPQFIKMVVLEPISRGAIIETREIDKQTQNGDNKMDENESDFELSI